MDPEKASGPTKVEAVAKTRKVRERDAKEKEKAVGNETGPNWVFLLFFIIANVNLIARFMEI